MSTQEKRTLRRLNKLLSFYVTKNHQPRWLYIDIDGRLDVGDHIMAEDEILSSKLAFIERMRGGWRSERLELPTTWVPTDSKIAPFLNDSANVYSINHMTAPIRHIVDSITRSALAERYLQEDGFAPSPDFCLQTYRTEPHFKHDNIQGFHEVQMTYDIEDELISPCEATVAPLMTYTGGEHSASYVVSGIFSGIPGCWLTLQPNYYLPTSLEVPQVQHKLDFAVLPYPQSSSFFQNKIRDAALGITFTHPAICMAMKGPRGWDSSGDNPTTITPIVRALAAHAKPNLDILLATWRIHHHHSSQCPPLPDYAIIFGVIYDARHLHIVAHFLTDNLDYVSLVVDTFDFPSVVDEDNVDFAAWSESRTRMVVALLTVQKHVHRLASLWDDVHFPQDIVQVSSELDDHIMGPTYMVRTSPSVISQMSNDSKWALYCCAEDDDEEDEDEDEEEVEAEEDADEEDEVAEVGKKGENKEVDEDDDEDGDGDEEDGDEDKDEVAKVAEEHKGNKEDEEGGEEDVIKELEFSPDPELVNFVEDWLHSVCLEENAWIEPESYVCFRERRRAPDVHNAMRDEPEVGNRWELFTKPRCLSRARLPQARAYDIRRAIMSRRLFLATPKQWLFSESDDDVSWDGLNTLRRAFDMHLKGALDYAIDMGYAECSETSSIVSVPRIYPDVDTSLNLDLAPRAFRVLLTHLSPISYERNVLNIMLETLPAFFEFPDCQVSHTYAPHPGSPSTLPLAIQSRMMMGSVPDSNSPTLLVALPWDARPFDEGQRMITSYFEWTLNLFIELHNRTPNSQPEAIPPWCVLHGILYSTAGVRVIAHYPEWNRFSSRWQLMSEITTFASHEEMFLLPRTAHVLQFAGILMELRRHAWEVKVKLEALLEQCGQNVLMEDLYAIFRG